MFLQNARSVIEIFFPWYFVEAPLGIVKSYGRYAKAFLEIFSFPFLLRTLFSPWKNLTDAYPKNLLNTEAFFEALTLNCLSRVIGCIFRLVMMAMGIVVQVLCLLLFVASLLLWITFPLLFLFGLAFLTYRLTP